MRASIYNAMPLEGVAGARRVHEGVRGASMARKRSARSWCSTTIAPGRPEALPGRAYAVVKDVEATRRDPGALRTTCTRTRSPVASRRSAAPAPGTNNIPVAALSKRGVPVFNAPGANANAVKELVLAGMLIAARNLVPGGPSSSRRCGATTRPGEGASRTARSSSPASSCPATRSA